MTWNWTAQNLVGTGATNVSVITSPSMTPTPYGLLILSVATNASGGGPTPTVDTANGITWTPFGSVLSISNYRWHLFRALPSAPTAGPITIRTPTQMSVCYYWCDQFLGASQAGVNGAGAIGQMKSASDTTGTATTLTLPTMAALVADAATYASFLPANFGAVPSPRPGWTQLRGSTNFYSQWINPGDPIASLAWQSASICVGQSFELIPAASQTITVTAGIPTGEAFGTPRISATLIVQATGIPSGEAFGVPMLALALAAVGIPSGAAFGV